MKRVIIIGGGFGGLYVATRLEKNKFLNVTLIDPSDFFVYNPLLHEVCIGEIPADAVKINFHVVLKRTKIIKLTVKKICFTEKKIILEDDRNIFYDYLVICSGSVPGFPITGSENLPTLKTLKDALRIKKLMNDLLRKRRSTISIIGEGATGTELTGEIATLSKFYKKEFEIHHFLYFRKYFENQKGFDNILKKRMKDLGVIIHQEEPVLKIDGNKIMTKSGVYYSDIIFACTGVRPLIIDSDLAFNKGYPVNDFCEVQGLKNVYAIGDTALFPYKGGLAAQLAQVARLQALYVAKDIVRKEKKKKRKPFRLKIDFFIISVGKYFGVIGMFEKFAINGFMPWFLKRTYYFFNVYSLKKTFKTIKHYLISLFLSKRFL